MVNLPARELDDGPAAWNLDEIRDMLSEIEPLELDAA